MLVFSGPKIHFPQNIPTLTGPRRNMVGNLTLRLEPTVRSIASCFLFSQARIPVGDLSPLLCQNHPTIRTYHLASPRLRDLYFV